MKRIIYLDHAATTKVKKEVVNEMIPFFNKEYGNASSMYSKGRNAKRAIENARLKIANAINANQKEIYFTSGGSESDNIALKGIAYLNRAKGNHIITSKIEHPAILNTCKTLENEGFIITYLDVDKDGLISLDDLKYAINNKTILISIMFANNEIGTIEPIKEIGEIAKNNNIIFHTDCVQALGNVKIDVKKMNIDVLSISGHKVYGPKGIGCIYIKEGIRCAKLIDGGHQEKDLRAGTENVPGIVGMGKAIEIANNNLSNYSKKLLFLREYFINRVLREIPNAKINGHRTKRLPGNINISFKGVEGEDVLLKLDESRICASAGSACSSGNNNQSHVLKAIGLDEELSRGTIRITLGDENTKNDIDYLINCLVNIVKELRNNNNK